MAIGIGGVNKNLSGGIATIGGVNKSLNVGYTGIGGVNRKVFEAYNYGDGHLNTVQNGYNGVVKVNGTPRWVSGTKILNGNYAGYYENGYKGTVDALTGPLQSYYDAPGTVFTAVTSRGYIYAGDNIYSFPAINTESTIGIVIFGGGWTTDVQIADFYLRINGITYTLQNAVNNGLIKPLVLLTSQSWSSPYIWGNLFNMYTGGATNLSTYPVCNITFMTNGTNSIDGFNLYANKAFNTTYDGYWVYKTDINNFRMTI